MVDRFRKRSFEEEEVLNQRPPVISNEDFNIKEKFFVDNDLGGIKGDL